jgi:hypothetical protein
MNSKRIKTKRLNQKISSGLAIVTWEIKNCLADAWLAEWLVLMAFRCSILVSCVTMVRHKVRMIFG